MKKLRLGTRGSKLALWQAEHVADLIKAKANIEVEIVIIKTKGDKILDVALSKIGDKGLFTKELEDQLLSGGIDMAVHSLKDLPTLITPRLIIGAVLAREKPQDVLIAKDKMTLAMLPLGAKIGTSSLRRAAQIKALRPDIITQDIRGNVETRIKKMQEQGLDGIILAYAGVKRLGLEAYISDIIANDIILPAVGQGAIAVEARSDDSNTLAILNHINHDFTATATTAERAFLRELEGGCQVPIAALARVEGQQLFIEGLVASLDGEKVYKATLQGELEEAEELGVLLAKELIARGALTILKDIRELGE